MSRKMDPSDLSHEYLSSLSNRFPSPPPPPPSPSTSSDCECTRSPATAPLGNLSVLPLEVVELILDHLDLRALVNFRDANKAAAAAVESLLEYQEIAAHARPALRRILAIETGPSITPRALLDTLRTAGCARCGRFGGYLYLITCERVCYRCCAVGERFRPLEVHEVVERYDMPASAVAAAALPCMRLKLPPEKVQQNGGQTHAVFVDHRAAYEAACEIHREPGARTVLHRYDSQTMTILRSWGNARLLFPEWGPYDALQNPLRFAAVVRAPWLRAPGQPPEWGVSCAACRAEADDPRKGLIDDVIRAYRTSQLFLPETLAEHMQLYGPGVGKDGRHFPAFMAAMRDVYGLPAGLSILYLPDGAVEDRVVERMTP